MHNVYKTLQKYPTHGCPPCLFSTIQYWVSLGQISSLGRSTGLNNVCACARSHGLHSRQRPGHHTKPRENGGIFKKFRMIRTTQININRININPNDYYNPVTDYYNPVIDYYNPVIDYYNPLLRFELCLNQLGLILILTLILILILIW